MKAIKCFVGVWIGVAVFSCMAWASSDTTPETLLQTSVDRIIEVLRDPGLKGEDKKEERRQIIKEVIATRFNYRAMSIYSLGHPWRNLSDEHKDEFVRLFGEFIESLFISKLEEYTNEKIKYTGSKVKKDKYADVYSMVVTADGKEIPITYKMKKTNAGDWLVYDMVIVDVDQGLFYRDQFGKLLANKEFDAVLQWLEQSIAEGPKEPTVEN